MEENEIGTLVVEASFKVHTVLGPGLLEGIYETCLAHELGKRGLVVRRQVALPVTYEDLTLEHAYRLDLLLNDKVVAEVKAIDQRRQENRKWPVISICCVPCVRCGEASNR